MTCFAIHAIVLAYLLGMAVGICLFAWLYNKELHLVTSKRRRFYP